MPLYMDLHIVPGVTARDVAEAHVHDVKIQDKYGCKAMTYWLDEDKGSVFCLIEAPDKESVRAMHEKAHGLIPHEIILVNTDVVRSFLGRIQDPEESIKQPDTMLKVFSDPAFRIILITKTTDTRLLQQQLGKERMQEVLMLYSAIMREQSTAYGGNEVYRREEGFVISFKSHAQAMDCAVAIRKKLQNTATLMGLRMALHAGVPVDNDDEIFGATIRFGQFLCSIAKPGEITITSDVRKRFINNDWNLKVDNIQSLTTADENFIGPLLKALAANWQNPEFDVPDFCDVMSLSKSQLYRKCIAMTDMSPNAFLREYRLQRSLELLRQEDRNISQITFDTGFSSPSYFTKCFQKRFGLAPLAYLKTRSV
jgi:AraC-like DNA-binding protein